MAMRSEPQIDRWTAFTAVTDPGQRVLRRQSLRTLESGPTAIFDQDGQVGS